MGDFALQSHRDTSHYKVIVQLFALKKVEPTVTIFIISVIQITLPEHTGSIYFLRLVSVPWIRLDT